MSDLLLRGFSADQALQELLKYENMVKQLGGAPGSAAGQVRALGNAEEAPRSSESLAVTTHGGQDGFSQPVTSYPLGSHLLSQALCTLLDMDVDEKDDAEAYGGYGGDQGPSLPAHSVSQEVAFEKLKTFGHLDGEKPSCLHQKLTKRGSNGFVTRWSCKDCGKVLNEEKKQQQSPPKASSLSSEPSCQHHRITWSGSNGSRWRQTCLDCGKITTGLWDEREPSALTRHLGERSGDATFSRETLPEMLRSLQVLLDLKMQECGGVVSLETCHKVLDALYIAMQHHAPRSEPLRVGHPHLGSDGHD